MIWPVCANLLSATPSPSTARRKRPSTWARKRDARAGNPPFLWTVLTDRTHRAQALKSGWKDVGKVFAIATVLDVVYQIVAKTGVRVLESLLVAFILALVPYMLFRGPITRILSGKRKSGA